MTLNSSSTSSSDASTPLPAVSARSVLHTSFWTLLWIVVIDAALGFCFRPPSDPRREPNRLQDYFDYGRSIEGKLRKMVASTDDQSAPISRAGWLGGDGLFQGPTEPTSPDSILVAAYGQSFTHHALEGAQAAEPSIEYRMIGGPAAPLPHSYKAAELDHKNHRAQIVLLGVLASSLQHTVAVTPMTWGFESPTPYTYPRYHVDRDNTLRETSPPIQTLAELRHVLAEPAAFRAFRDALANDPAFNAFVFDEGLLDRSVFGRLTRRAMGHSHQASYTARYHSAAGFTNRDGLIDIARALTQAFAARVRSEGRVPFMILFEDRGYEGHLEQVFVPALKASSTPYLSTREVAPAGDLRNFSSDGHFTTAANERIGKLLATALQRALARGPSTPRESR